MNGVLVRLGFKNVLLLALMLVSYAPVSAGPYDDWNDGELVVTFLGRGMESGLVLDLEVLNKGTSTKKFQLPQLTVLEPNSSAYAPVLVESKGAWEMKPGGTFTLRVSGYSLDQSKKMPSEGQKLVYRPTTGGKRYQKAQLALKKSLQVEQKPGFQAAILPADKHRSLVIQRVIWRSYGGNNPKTAQALVDDLDKAFQRKGRAPSDKVVNGLAASIWRDVEKVCKSLVGS